MKQISSKKWVFMVLAVTWAVFIGCAVLVITIDPYLHYRIPDNGLNYNLKITNQRYHNDGIVRYFEYDAVITGTSMTENFKTSEFDEIYGTNSIKIPFSGGSYNDVNDACIRVLEARPDTKIILRSLDLSRLLDEKNASQYSDYPEYLYNDKLMDDVSYWLNKMAILEGCMIDVVLYSIGSEEKFLDTFSFDEYSTWYQVCSFGKESVLASYVRSEKSTNIVKLTDEEKEMILENVTQNVTELACAYPDTTFLLFFPPYSICYWDVLKNTGQTDWRIDAEQAAIEEILKYPNIKLYSFCNNFELVCNLDNYKDQAHYGEWINSLILEWMHNGEYLLTKDNYKEYIKTIRNFYNSYDYNSLHK